MRKMRSGDKRERSPKGDSLFEELPDAALEPPILANRFWGERDEGVHRERRRGTVPYHLFENATGALWSDSLKRASRSLHLRWFALVQLGDEQAHDP